MHLHFCFFSVIVQFWYLGYTATYSVNLKNELEAFCLILKNEWNNLNNTV